MLDSAAKEFRETPSPATGDLLLGFLSLEHHCVLDPITPPKSRPGCPGPAKDIVRQDKPFSLVHCHCGFDKSRRQERAKDHRLVGSAQTKSILSVDTRESGHIGHSGQPPLAERALF